jgi:hypothetical protein
MVSDEQPDVAVFRDYYLWLLDKMYFVRKLELWTTPGKIGVLLGKQVDIRRLDMLIAMCVLGE